MEGTKKGGEAANAKKDGDSIPEVEGIRAYIGADSLAYISLDQLIESTNVAKDDLCRACFDGVYPVELPEPQFLGKHMLEGMERTVAAEHAGGVTAGGGANDALLHP